MLVLIICALVTWTIGYYVWRYMRELEMLPGLEKRSVFITGCDSGFGNGTVFECLKHGMTVFAACQTEEISVRGVEEQAKSYKGKVHAFVMDVRSDESVEKARKLVEDTVGINGLHGLVNNAGVAGEFVWDEWQTPDQYREVYEVNLVGVVRVTHAMRQFLKKTKGRIVNVSSSFAVSAPAQIGPYACSKYAVEAYSDVCRRELGVFGIQVCIVEPGFLKTPMNNANVALKKMEVAWNRQPESIKQEYGEDFYKFTCATTRARYAFLSDPQLVVDAYFHGLTAKHCRTRYRPGIDAVLYYTLSAHFPTKFQDWWFQIHPGYAVKHPKDCVGKY
ncbi:17-beta-hydroxysteroid dehydrogenase type 6 [Aphelenchoides bicaudatus]|nr:17-beta-hydroxysteroid dehydrogenase type 6 [Aphelenchoides bicaudatus]